MTTLERESLYRKAQQHKIEHACGGVPYEYGGVLTSLVAGVEATSILEVGTGIGYSTVCLAAGNRKAVVHTIDKDHEHMVLAEGIFKEFSLAGRIHLYEGIAEDIVPTLTEPFDFIFYDGYIPQKKFVAMFHQLLKPGGMLITANLFLSDPSGGRYVKLLQEEKHWTTGIFADTALSVKAS